MYVLQYRREFSKQNQHYFSAFNDSKILCGVFYDIMDSSNKISINSQLVMTQNFTWRVSRHYEVFKQN